MIEFSGQATTSIGRPSAWSGPLPPDRTESTQLETGTEVAPDRRIYTEAIDGSIKFLTPQNDYLTSRHVTLTRYDIVHRIPGRLCSNGMGTY